MRNKDCKNVMYQRDIKARRGEDEGGVNVENLRGKRLLATFKCFRKVSVPNNLKAAIL